MTDRYASLKQGLVGCWIPSVSGSGLLLPDLSGRGNNGSLVGMDASDWVSSQYGRALDFDGVDDKATATHPLGVGVSRCTFSVWMRKTSASDIAISSIGSETANSRFHISWFSDGQLYCTVENGASSYGEFTPSFTSNFRNYCLVYDGTQATNASRLRVFLDGQQVSLSYTDTIPSTAISSNVVAIGAGSGSFSKSQQDDIRIYSRALTESEIKLLASEPGIGFKPAKKLSRFSQRFTYKPPKARNYSVIRNRDPNYSTLRQGLVAAYCPSISGQGNVLPDLVGGNHGTLTNMTAEDWVSSGDGRALEFDGVNDVVAASNTTTGNLGTSDATISFWARLNNANAFSTIVCKRASTGGAQWHIDQGYVNNVGSGVVGKQIGLFWYTGVGGLSSANTQSFYTTNDVVDGNWHHIAVRRINGTTPAFFIDGVSVAVTAAINGTTNINADQTTDPITIGADRVTGLGGQVTGVLDDVRIYNRALSEPEIKLLASKRGIGLQPRNTHVTFADLGVQKTYSVVRVKETDYATLRQGLVGAWCPSLPNGGSGNTLPDVSGYGNHGSLVNMSPDDWVSGQYGRALDFDGTDDVTRVALSAPAMPFTISAWILSRSDSANQFPIAFCRSASDEGQFSIRFAGNVAGDPITVRQEGDAGGTVGEATFTGYATNQWYHVAAIFRSNAYRQIYVNGVAGTENTTSVTTPSINRFAIGRFDRLNPAVPLNGNVDDVRVYSRELSEPEIRLLASRPGIGLRQESHRNTFYQFPSGARRKRILTGMP